VIEAELEKMSPDMDAIEAWRQKSAEYGQRASALDVATAERDAVRQRYETLRRERLERFMSGFHVISSKLKEMYQVRL
jgi:structural maintenance of chromosome 4